MVVSQNGLDLRRRWSGEQGVDTLDISHGSVVLRIQGYFVSAALLSCMQILTSLALSLLVSFICLSISVRCSMMRVLS